MSSRSDFGYRLNFYLPLLNEKRYLLLLVTEFNAYFSLLYFKVKVLFVNNRSGEYAPLLIKHDSVMNLIFGIGQIKTSSFLAFAKMQEPTDLLDSHYNGYMVAVFK